MRGSRDGGTGGRSDFFGNIRSLRLTGFGVACERVFPRENFHSKGNCSYYIVDRIIISLLKFGIIDFQFVNHSLAIFFLSNRYRPRWMIDI